MYPICVLFEVLQAAACVIDDVKCKDPKGLHGIISATKFFDVGSGQGKFPTYATILGFASGHGTELDQKRFDVAAAAEKAFDEEFKCLKAKSAVRALALTGGTETF